VKRGLKALNFESPYLTTQPPELIRLQVHSKDAREFLDRLCGPNGYKPLGDDDFAATIGLDENSQWQVKQLRSGKQALNNSQKQALLKACGYLDGQQIDTASQLLSQMPNIYNITK
jgi:hypothetical protein